MDDAGSGARPPGPTPEELALEGFSPDAHAEVVGVYYGSDDVVSVEVGFPGNGPHIFRQIHRWGEDDWRHEKFIIDDPLIDPSRDLAEQLVGRRFGGTTVEEANGHIGQWATGQTVYFLEVRLSGQDVSPEELRLLGRAVTSHARRSGVTVSMTHSES
jgi:hypothetical protein